MIPNRPCKRCRNLTRNSSGICADCAGQHETQTRAERYAREPWRRLYAKPAWKYAKKRTLVRDGYQCRALLEDGTRCKETEHLQVHHLIPLRVLWELGANAFADRVLVSLCPKCHARADEALRKLNRTNDEWAASLGFVLQPHTPANHHHQGV